MSARRHLSLKTHLQVRLFASARHGSKPHRCHGLSDGYYMAYELITLPCILFVFIEIHSFIVIHV